MLHTIIGIFIPSFVVSFMIALTLVATKRFHGRYTYDGTSGVQKNHTSPTPRIGGISVFLGLATSLLLLPQEYEVRQIGLTLLLCSTPAFIVGLLEDISKRVSPRTRLLSHLLSAVLLVFYGGYILRHSGFFATDILMQFTPIAVIVSVFAIAGMTNAVNIIDGYNGLASGSSIIMALTYAGLSLRLGDTDMFVLSLLVALAVGGFFVWNFPFGKLFLGDAGAYLIGFMLCAQGLVICARHPGLSPWVVLLVMIYPVWEILISILRRFKRKGHHPSQPDKVHLHNLMFRSLVRPATKNIHIKQYRNSITGASLWPFPALTGVLVLNIEMTTLNSLVAILIFYTFYNGFYKTFTYRN